MASLKKLIDILESQIGYRESGNNHQKYSPAVPGLEWSQNQPWCATFNSWAYLKAGLKPNVDFPVTASCLAGVSWYKSRGRWSGTPKVGSQVFYGPNGGTHVEIVVAVSGSTITTIGGNTSGSLRGVYYNGDGVYKKTVARGNSRIYGYGMPYNLTDSDGKAPDMYVSLGNKKWEAKPKKGQTFYLHFDHEASDATGQHGDGKAYPTILTDPAYYVATVGVSVYGLTKDESCWIRSCEVEKQKDGSFKVVETGATQTIRGRDEHGSVVYVTYTWADTMTKHRRMRVQMGGIPKDGIRVVPTSVKLLGWER